MSSLKRTKSASRKSTNCLVPIVLDQSFLSREQTDEWKGWMQALILIYHYTGASQTLGIYKAIRLCVASYLFMTGYGHTLYFLRRRDYSLRRHAGVLIRLNLLSCILPYVMHTDYLFYYFAPLTTFWYLMIAATLWIKESRNRSTIFLLSKIVLSAALVSALHLTPGVLETMFYLLHRIFRINWNLQEWRFRVHLDSFIVPAGMILAVAFVRLSDPEQNVDAPAMRHQLTRRSITQIRLISVVLAALAVFAFWFVAGLAGTKQEFNWWMPYTSWLPVLSFVVLRNSTGGLRSLHSSVFAWLGRHSLETFTLQFHIWLAADTQGLLGLGIFRAVCSERIAMWIDFACITMIFLWVTWFVTAATNTATAWIVDPKAGRPDIDIDSAKERAPTLPMNKSKQCLNGRLRDPRSTLSNHSRILKLLNRVMNSVRRNLTVRLGLIVAVLWLLNLVSLRTKRNDLQEILTEPPDILKRIFHLVRTQTERYACSKTHGSLAGRTSYVRIPMPVGDWEYPTEVAIKAS